MPLDRMLVETDAPYLAPVQFYRGKAERACLCSPCGRRNCPVTLPVAREVALATTTNFIRLFKIPAIDRSS